MNYSIEERLVEQIDYYVAYRKFFARLPSAYSEEKIDMIRNRSIREFEESKRIYNENDPYGEENWN